MTAVLAAGLATATAAAEGCQPGDLTPGWLFLCLLDRPPTENAMIPDMPNITDAPEGEMLFRCPWCVGHCLSDCCAWPQPLI